MKIPRILLLASILFSASSAYGLVINGTSNIDLHDNESFVSTYDTSTLTMHSGSSISFLSAYDASTVNTNSNSSISFLDGHDSSTFNIDGGTISWISTYDNNTTNLSFAESISWLLVHDNSTVNIFGSNFNYASGHLSGTWSNGIDFSFWALKGLDLSSGNISDILPDNILLHSVSVPEPSNIALLLIATGLLIIRRRSKSQQTERTFAKSPRLL